MITFAPSESITTVTEKKKIGLFPLLKMGSLRTSQSTPIRNKKDAPAQINFYKEDQQKKDGFIFATDAIVDHPLRIGVGYGSYICYQCTILSDKVNPEARERACVCSWLLMLCILGRSNYSQKEI